RHRQQRRAEGRKCLEPEGGGGLEEQHPGEPLYALALADGDVGPATEVHEAPPRVLEPCSRALHLGSQRRRRRGGRAGSERQTEEEEGEAARATSYRSSAGASHPWPGAASRAPPAASSSRRR